MPQTIDLTIQGKPTPRIERPGSGGTSKSPLNVNRARSRSSNIFGTDHEENKRGKSGGTKSQPQKTKANPVSVVTKSELEAIKKLTEREDGKGNTQQVQNEQRSKTDIAVQPSARKAAPKGVPQLSLDAVVGTDDDLSYAKAGAKDHRLESPTSKDTYSWGSPLSKPVSARNPVKGGGWQVNQSRKAAPTSTQRSKKPDNVPDLDLQLSASNDKLVAMRQVAKQVQEDIRIEYLGTGKQPQVNKSNEVKDEPKAQVQPGFGQARKKEFIEDSIILDQLARVKVNDESPQKPSQPFGLHEKFDPRAQRHNDLFQNRAVATGAPDNSLSKRLRFGARILTTNGRDARREINGFYFCGDETLTMYEFRQFGTRSNALPFITRGQYCHVNGPRCGQPYRIHDIEVGRNVTFHTDTQTSLPDNLRTKPVISFRITEVDGEQRKKLIFGERPQAHVVREKEREIQNHRNEEEASEYETLSKVQDALKNKLKSRGSKTLTNLCRKFQQLDTSGDGALNPDEMRRALKDFRLELDEQEFANVWDIVDRNKDGSLDFGEFVRGFVGEMSEGRKAVVRKAFNRIDPNKSGEGSLNDMKKFYCARKHPSVANGEISEQQAMQELLEHFENTRSKGHISYVEFEAYYEGVSLAYDSDNKFIAMMKNVWSV